MTHRNRREQDRAVRAYKRAHPGITLEQARRAVAARAERQQGLPARIPATPLPRPAERLDDYVRRVAAAAGVQQHRAMELLGLEPGTSATDRLNDLAAGLDDHTVQALVAATGMTTEQAHALTAPRSAHPDLAVVRRITEANFAAGHYRRAGEGKTSTSPGLSAALSTAFPERARMIDLDGAGHARLLEGEHIQPGGTGKTRTDTVDSAWLLAETHGSQVLPVDLPAHELFPTDYRSVVVDLDWPFDAPRPPIDPEVFNEVAKALGIGQDPDPDAPQPE